jgi:membrane fusion protein (multidrug efflux system)
MANEVETNEQDTNAERGAGAEPGEPNQNQSPELLDEYGEPLGEEHKKKTPLYKRPAFLIGAVIVLIIVALLGIRYWLYARSHESTDDAFVDGHIVQVSPKVSGSVTKIYVSDNQQIKAGDLIAELDARDFEVKVAQAKAELDAGYSQQRQAQNQVALTKAASRAGVQQAAAGVQQARAGVAGAQAGASAESSRTNQSASAVKTAQANLEQTRAQVSAAAAEAARANADVLRYQALFDKDEVSRQRLDLAIAVARTANAQVDAAREKVAAALAQVNEARSAEAAQADNAQRARTQINGAQAQVNEALGRLAQANTAPQQVAVSQSQAETSAANLDRLKAAVDQAELQLSYTKIYAPEGGRVTRKSIEVGGQVQIGQPLMAIVPGDVWVTANFKESQVGKMRPGQSVEISVDAYPDKVFKGHVDSIQAGTGAKFSLLPAENATGNYVKVVQRLPVKIVFDESPDPQHMLAPGMSVVPAVKIK